MNTRLTWLLFLVALALGGYVYVSERRVNSPGPVVGSFVYTSFEPAAVRAVEFLRSNIVIRVERSTNGWRMALPVSYSAQGTAVDAFLDALAALRPRTLIPASQLMAAGGTNDLRAFGLDSSAITVKLETGDEPIIFQLGGPTPL